jgi:hypothetical protein
MNSLTVFEYEKINFKKDKTKAQISKESEYSTIWQNYIFAVS